MPITTDKTVQFFPVPVKGVRRDVPPHALPLDALRASRNVIVRDGVLRPRPSFDVTFGAGTAMGGKATGSGLYYKTDGSEIIIVPTTTKVFAVSAGGATRTDLSGGLTATLFTHIGRVTTIALGAGGSVTNYAIITNGKDSPKKWDGAAGSVSAVAGSPPLWTDITTIDDKVIGLIPPYQVTWGATRSIGVWPALNFKQMAETSDPVVAIRPGPGQTLGTVYKKNSIWSIVPTGNSSDASAFRFPFAAIAEGPANPQAIVDVNGQQFRMTASGRIGVWDGTKNVWVAKGIWPAIRQDIFGFDPRSVFGWYDPAYNEINFSWFVAGTYQWMLTLTAPPDADSDYGCWLSTVNLKLHSDGISDSLPSPAIPPLTTAVYSPSDNVAYLMSGGEYPANGSYPYRYGAQMGQDGGAIDTVVANSLSSVAVTTNPIFGWWETGLMPTPNLEAMRVESVETFAERGQKYGNLTLTPVYSYTLGNSLEHQDLLTVLVSSPSITLYPRTAKPVLVSLQGKGAGNASDMEPARADVGVDVQGRFLGLRYSFSTADPTGDGYTRVPRFYGAALKAQRVTP